jgi:hypothetical protein
MDTQQKVIIKITCPQCRQSESIPEAELYGTSRYTKFDAKVKSTFGFQKLLLKCRNCSNQFSIDSTEPNEIVQKIHSTKLESEREEEQQREKIDLAIKESAGDFKPEQYQFTTKFPATEKITVSCQKCKKQYEILNPAFDRKDEKLNLLDINIFRQSGCIFKIAVLIASLPAIFVASRVESPIAAIILWLILMGPIYLFIREVIVKAFGGMYNVGYVTCDNCQEKTYVAYNPRWTKLLTPIKPT